MKVKYNHPAIPFNGIEVGTEYDLTIKEDKAILSKGEFKLEITKYQAEEMFEKVKTKNKK